MADEKRTKLLHLVQIFREYTDDQHGLTISQLASHLGEHGIEVERKTLYKDIEFLRSYGLDIAKHQGKYTEYSLLSREFEDVELALLADAVQTSKFLTQSKADALVRKISKLGSKYLAQELQGRIFVQGRVKTQNNSVLYNVDKIQRALREKLQIRFYYFKYDENKNEVKQHEGRPYVMTPVALVYSDEKYYLYVWNEKYEGFTMFRVDRMKTIKVLDEPAVTNEQISAFEVGEFMRQAYGMYSGEKLLATLRVAGTAMSAIVDRFGADIDVHLDDEEGFSRVVAPVMEAPTFYAWLVRHAQGITLLGPEKTKQAYAAYLQEILDKHAGQEAE